MLDERLRNHTDAIATPVELSEVMSHGGDGVFIFEGKVIIEETESVAEPIRTRWLVAIAAVLLLFVIGGFVVESRRDVALDIADGQGVSAERSTDEALPDELSPVAQFSLCLEILEASEQPELSVRSDPNGGISIGTAGVGNGEISGEVELCFFAVNEAAGLENSTDEAFFDDLPISTVQAAALEDGVTQDELAEGLQNASECFERGGGNIDPEPAGGESRYTWGYSEPFLPRACLWWNIHPLEIEQGRIETRDAAAAALPREMEVAQEVASAFIQDQSDLDALLNEAADLGCETAYGDRAWITVYDDMAQPRCIIVSEAHDLDFVNKGFETATIAWPDGERVLRSDESFPTGRIGSTFDIGKHVITTNPYGEVTLYVTSPQASLSARLGVPFVFDDTGLEDSTVDEIEALFGNELEVTEPGGPGRCEIRRLVGDPHSPPFAFLADETSDDATYVLLSNRHRCE